MADIRQLLAVDAHLLDRLIAGYTSSEVYQVARHETPGIIRFELRLTTLEHPFVKRYPPDAETSQYYQELAATGHSFGAFEGEVCVGIALSEPHHWNRSLMVHEFHIAPGFQRRGIGQALMAAVEEHARTEGMRCVVCETQNTNVPAIRFYRALGFSVDGIDMSLYTNDDIARGEVAVYMKKYVADAER